VYGIEGIPTTVIVNQQGVVVAVTHPAQLKTKHLEEVIRTGSSSLPPPAEPTVRSGDEEERVPATKPVFEVSVRPSGPMPRGHGFDCWTTSATNADLSGEYASVRQAILTLFDGRPTLLDCRVTLPKEQYDFTLRLPPGASHADREQVAAGMFRTVFGLIIRRVETEREVYILSVSSTNAPGLLLSSPGIRTLPASAERFSTFHSSHLSSFDFNSQCLVWFDCKSGNGPEHDGGGLRARFVWFNIGLLVA
jgi:hypothetical protein